MVAAISFYFVSAQTPQELGIPTAVQISPIRFDWDLEDGDEKTGTVNLKNYSDETYEVLNSVENFYVSDDSTQARFFIPGEGHPLKAYDVINWIELPERVVLAPKEGKDITFKVKVPKGTPTGGYYGALFFQSQLEGREGIQEIPTDDGTSKIIVNQRVGTLLVMAVKGDQPIRRSGELIDFFPEKKVFWSSPAALITQVKNSGNLHYKALGKIEVTKFGKKMADLDLKARVLYPDRIRTYAEGWNFSNWSYGFYRAKLALQSEDGEIKMSGETSFWVIPWKTTVSILVLLFIIWLIMRIFTSRFEIRRKDDDNKDGLKPDEEIPIDERNFDENGDQQSSSGQNYPPRPSQGSWRPSDSEQGSSRPPRRVV